MSFSAKNFVRAYNRYNILNTIRIHEKISRTDISKVTGLSPAAITEITSELVNEGLILEKEAGEYAGGRRPIFLAINPEGTYVMGVNIKRYAIYVVIINFQGEMKASYKVPIEDDYHSPEELVEKITYGILTCLWESHFSKDKIAGIGISIPALVDSASGIVRHMPLYDWKDVDIKGMLQQKVNHTIYIDNDTNNLALGEHWFGEGKGLKNFIVVSLERIIGAGCVMNGQLLRGHSGMAGGFGNMVVDPEGPCGKGLNKGSISAFAGMDAILDKATIISDARGLKTGEEMQAILFEDLVENAVKSNAELMDFLSKAGRALGVGLANLIQLFNPEKIIIGGIGVRLGDALLTPMYESIASQLENFKEIQTNFVTKPWVKELWAIGAGTLVLQEIYKSPAHQYESGRLFS